MATPPLTSIATPGSGCTGRWSSAGRSRSAPSNCSSRASSAGRPTWATARRRSPPASPGRCAPTTTRSARTAATTTRSPGACRWRPILAELFGRGTGLMGGKGGSMHLTSVEHGAMGSYAIVGAHLPIAVGAAWSAQYRKSGQVAVCFFGDGTTNIGAFHEALNLAAVWQVPVVFVCENNQYMEYTPIGAVTAVEQPAADRASAYGLEAIVVDGNDVRRRPRGRPDGDRPGPRRRWPGAHRGPDVSPRRPLAGRSGQVPAGRRGRGLDGTRPDPGRAGAARSPRASARPRRSRHRGRDARRGRRCRGERARAARSPIRRRSRPSCGATEARHGGTDLPPGDRRRDRPGDGPRPAGRVHRRGRRRGRAACSRRPRACSSGSAPERVRDTPISEQAIVGAVMGAAMTGLRPIGELMFSDFFAVAWDMVANQIAKTRYMTDGQVQPAARPADRQRRRPALRRPAQPERRELGDGDPRASRSSRRRRRPTCSG